MDPHFQAEQWVPYSRERVFAFFADPANLPPLMPAWQRTRVQALDLVPLPPDLKQTFPGTVAGQGSRITISFRPVPLIPFRLGWVAFIAEFRWNEGFCDEQRRGPFKFFRHCHRIRDEHRGDVAGAVVADDVDYELPMGRLGDLANGIAVSRQIRSLFAHRQRMLLQLLAKSTAHKPDIA